MKWLAVALIVLAILAGMVGLYLWAKSMARREPYRKFLKLSTKGKMRFFKELVADRRIPLWIRLLPFLVVLYLASPIDLIPDFIPVLGYLDDVAIVLLMVFLVARFTPAGVVQEVLDRYVAQELS